MYIMNMRISSKRNIIRSTKKLRKTKKPNRQRTRTKTKTLFNKILRKIFMQRSGAIDLSEYLKKKIIITTNLSALDIIKERTAATKSESMWQIEQTDLDNNTGEHEALSWENLITDEDKNNMVEILKSPPFTNIKQIIPALEINPVHIPSNIITHAPDGTSSYILEKTTHYAKQDEDVNETIASIYKNHSDEKRKIMSATLIIMGIISSKLLSTNQEYMIISKGGLSVSLAISKLMNGDMDVPLNDIDFRIMPNVKRTDVVYNKDTAHKLSSYICDIVKFVLSQITEPKYTISVIDNSNPTRHSSQQIYPDLIKLSIRVGNGTHYIPILDLDFGEDEKNIEYFKNTFKTEGPTGTEGGTQMPTTFVYQSDIRLLAEKLYYYAQYLRIKELFQTPNFIVISERNPESVVNTQFGIIGYNTSSKNVTFDGNDITEAACDRFLEKFKKSIIYLNTAILKSSVSFANISATEEINANLTVAMNTLERLFIIRFLTTIIADKTKLLFRAKVDNKYIIQIVDSIYPRTEYTLV